MFGHRRKLTIITLIASIGLFIPSYGLASLDDDSVVTISPAEQLPSGLSSSVVAKNSELILGDNGVGIYDNKGIFISPIMEAPAAFDAVHVAYGATIPDGTQLEFFVRAFAGSTPSRWHRVELEGEALFDAVANRFQYQIVFSSDVPTATPAVDTLVFCFAKLVKPSTEDPTIEPQVGITIVCPDINERQDWNARPAKENYAQHEIEYIIVHHTAAPTIANYQGASTVRGIQNFHMDVRKWNDVGYHFIIGPDGAIFRGRPELAIGAHCIPNTGKVGISIVGNYMEETPEQASLEALVSLIAYLAAKHELSIDRIKGHRDFSTSVCPGDNLYDLMDGLRNSVQELLDAAALELR